MKAAEIRLGPVLSFRGVQPQEGGVLWQVTALVGFGPGDPPALSFEGAVVDGDKRKHLVSTRKDLHVYRYDLTCRLAGQERRVRYGFAGTDGPGSWWEFTVPSDKLRPRMAYASCNGYSDPKSVQKHPPSVANVWSDMVACHDYALAGGTMAGDREQAWHVRQGHGGDAHQRFHLLLMGGDQIYFDSIWRRIKDLEAFAELSLKRQLTYQHPDPGKLMAEIEDYYFDLYRERWGVPNCDQLPDAGWQPPLAAQGEKPEAPFRAADAMARIPTVMMWDDHDITDGWGSFPDALQGTWVMQALFDCASRAFEVFQLQLPGRSTGGARQAPELASLGVLERQGGLTRGMELDDMALLVLDLRSERTLGQILSDATWEAVGSWLERLGAGVRHLLVMSSVPVGYPIVPAVDWALDAHDRIRDALTDGIGDDVRDHWNHAGHQNERDRLIRLLAEWAEQRGARVVIASGDVHLAARATIERQGAGPQANWLRLQQLVSSAVVHPSPSGLPDAAYLYLLEQHGIKPVQIGAEYTCTMRPLQGSNRLFIPSRNWLALDPHEEKKAAGLTLWATWRCEVSEGTFRNHVLVIDPPAPGRKARAAGKAPSSGE